MNDKNGFEPEYDDPKESDTLFIGKNKLNKDGSSYRKVEVILDCESGYIEKTKIKGLHAEEFTINKDIVLYKSGGEQQKINCWLISSKECENSTSGLHISKRTGKGVYGSNEITLFGQSIYILKKFLDKLFSIKTSEGKFQKLTIDELAHVPDYNKESVILSEEEFKQLIENNVENIDVWDKIIAIKKRHLAVERLKDIMNGNFSHENEIEDFLKDNLWMLGNEYVVFRKTGKINDKNLLDIIPANFESFIDVIEVKRPEEILFNSDTSHKNFYCTSDLTKAIAQTQNYIYELEKQTNESPDENGYKIIRPQGIILMGSKINLSNEEKKYLRILNSSYHNLKVYTYQQLLEKAENTLKLFDNSQLEGNILKAKPNLNDDYPF